MTEASDETDLSAAEIDEIESLPLAQRAERFDLLAQRLGAELENSDPARQQGTA